MDLVQKAQTQSIVDLAIVVDILWKGALFVWQVEMVQLTN